MKKLLLTLALTTYLIDPIVAQDSMNVQVKLAENNSGKVQSPYKTKLLTDGLIIAGGIGTTALGVKLISEKRDFTAAEIALKTRDKVPFFDRGNAGYYSKQADDDSYIPFKASFVMPVVMGLINKNQRQHYGQVLVLYTETMAITGALFTMATGNIYRSRPYVYGNNASLDMKMDKDSHRSFYAGHTAATAAATFYMAKSFADFNPNSKAKVYVWVVAATVPAVVGYLRYKAGMHFLSDNILGYALGAGAGILVPHFHKYKIKNVAMMPEVGRNYKGLSLTYHIR